MMTISQRIRQLRLKGLLTLDDLSQRSGIAKASLSRIENNKHMPSLPVLDKIAKSLGTSIRDILIDIEFNKGFKNHLKTKDLKQISTKGIRGTLQKGTGKSLRKTYLKLYIYTTNIPLYEEIIDREFILK